MVMQTGSSSGPASYFLVSFKKVENGTRFWVEEYGYCWKLKHVVSRVDGMQYHVYNAASIDKGDLIKLDKDHKVCV